MVEKPIWWANRHSFRLLGHDYTRPEAYFVTLCSHQKRCLFGEVVEGRMRLSQVGSLVETEWGKTAQVRSYVQLDRYVVMPNHFHAILVFMGGKPTSKPVPTEWNKAAPRLVAGSLGAVMAQFKSMVTKGSRTIGLQTPIWQANYHEHLIRDEESLNCIRDYIDTNPLRWHLDQENPANVGEDSFAKWLEQAGEYRGVGRKPS